jgi:xanthine dehydrogenase small subunit
MLENKKSHSSIQFVLDGTVHEATKLQPSRTLLDYLREDLQRTGTKEGCAEGDCGACTIVIGELDANGKNSSLHTANACLQCLPTLDGKQLFTVESLSEDLQSLHPVQQAIVDNHASQCGFCTPGFVMSLFWLYKNRTTTNYNELLKVLSGNICRCTGYRPIIDAGLSMHASTTNRKTGFAHRETTHHKTKILRKCYSWWIVAPHSKFSKSRPNCRVM